MALVTRGDEGKEPMADDVKSGSGPEPRRRDEDEAEESRQEAQRPAAAPAGAGGFFRLYKPGQGYWTRLGTVAAAGLLLALIARYIYVQLGVWTTLNAATNVAIVVGIVVGAALLLWRYLNKPLVVDFLIATESEMRKVNWTSRKDLMGSTRVVILFMFLIAAILFVIDIAFGYLFWLIGVLKHGPFS